MRNSIGFGCAWAMLAAVAAGCSNEGSEAPRAAWCPINEPGEHYRAVSFPEPLTGTIVGGIYRTEDGGYTWTSQGPSEDQRYNDVVFTDANTGTIVGPEGIISRTTDGGATWVAQDSGTETALYGVSLADADNGMAVGADGTILHTTDGGTTWAVQESGTSALLRGVWMSDSSTATAVGDGGTILRTTDGGATWMPQESGAEHDLHAISFASSSTGVAVGPEVTMLRTTDGGATWVVQDLGTQAPLFDIWFADENVGTAVGGEATILRTTDAGATWAAEGTDAYYTSWEIGSEPVELGLTFYGVSMADAENGVAIGELDSAVRRMNVQDDFGVCDPFCDKYTECAAGEMAPCDIVCRCELRYASDLSADCERAVADWIGCFSSLTCEQIEAYFEDFENHPCAAVSERVDVACY